MGQSDIADIARRDCEIERGYEGLAQSNADDHYELNLLVDGIHCAACIQKIESSLERDKDIKTVRLNFSTGRLSVSWDGQAARANDFVSAVENLGYGVRPYDAQTENDQVLKQERFLLLCLGVAGFSMGNVMMLSVGVWSTSAETMGMATRDIMHWVSACIALPTILFSGRPFFRSALGVLVKGHTNMDVPISLALLLAGGMSLFETINHGEHVYFDSAVMLIFFLLIGRYLDFRARKNARSSATSLLSALSGFANVVKGNQITRTLIRDLQEGMIIRISTGEKFPIDGILTKGQTTIDISLITGETLPAEASSGSEVFAGTLNLSAPVEVKVTKPSEKSLLADIVRLMEKAGQAQARYVRIADRAARLYTPVVHTCALLAFFGWILIGGLAWQPSLMIAITVLIITCPCALGLAVPVVQVLATGQLMKKGILVKAGDALERLAVIDTIIFDKTGTLTRGDLNLITAHDDHDLGMAASLAVHSLHPLSQAIVKAYDRDMLEMKAVKEHAGQGISGHYKNKTIRLGSRAWCGDESARASSNIELWLDRDGHKTCFGFSDQLRCDAAQTMESLRHQNIDVWLVSGDRATVVDEIAQMLEIENAKAEHTPTQKFDIMRTLQKNGRKVMMVGDGLNDAPVLSGADISMAPGTAIDMAQNAADIIFMGDKLAPVLQAHKIAKLSQRLVKQNFALALIYNLFAIPFALSGLVTPLIAALCMSGSSLLVIANSFRLRWMS